MVKKVTIKNYSRKLLISNSSQIYSLLLICALGFIIYSNSFDCSFHFDDLLITKNIAFRDINNVKAIWDLNNRRFAENFTFALNYHFHQLDVFGYHVVNLLIHLAASVFLSGGW